MIGAAQCLVRSVTSPTPNSPEFAEGDLRRALTASVSFGRFMNEPLDWERWSSFSQNRILEDVKKHSRPGSVAEKKAFFETHYKRFAAKKAVKSPRRASKSPRRVSKSPKGANEASGYSSKANTARISPEKEIKLPDSSSTTNAATDNVPVDSDLAESNSLLAIDETQEHILGAAHVDQEEASAQKVVSSENQIQVEFSSQLEKNVEKDKQEEEEKTNVKDVASQRDELPSGQNMSAVSKSSSKNGAYKLRYPVRPPPLPVGPEKEEIATTKRRKATRDVMDKKSLHMSMHFTSPAQKSNDVYCSASACKNGKSRTFKAIATAPKARLTQQTPTRVSVHGALKHSQVLPRPENRRSETLLDRSVTGSRTSVGKPSENCSGSSSACTEKRRLPTAPSSFYFRCEERAAKRKEFFQKLVEKTNTEKARKVQAQPKLKEKAENGNKKFNRSFVFDAEPSTSKMKPLINNMKKVLPTQTQPLSPKLGKKRTASIHNGSCPWRSPPKTKNIIDKSNKKLGSSVAYLPSKKMHENASPNIQPKKKVVES